MSSFESFGLLPSLQLTLAEQGLRVPTPIQQEAVPALLAGRSAVCVAETGSGKTLAYALPLLQQLKLAEESGSKVELPQRPRAVVLAPSRELGEQIARVFKKFTHETRIRVRTVLGGSPKAMARRNTSGPFELLVATPGRLLQLLDEGTVDLSDVRSLVFDEADQMLDPGFLPAAAKIVAACPPQRQLALVSATLPGPVQQLVKELFKTPPLMLRTEGSHRLVPTLTTVNRAVVDGRRFELLKVVLGEDPGGSTLLFANTHEQVDKLARELDGLGVAYVTYRGDMEVGVRKENLRRFRDGEVRLLLATDLGSRGLDLEEVTRVINYHLPHQLENYLHRAGRTARAGRPGLVVNFVTERDREFVAKLEKVRARPSRG